MGNFNTPLKRLGFLFFVVGLFLIVISLFIQIAIEGEHFLNVLRDSLYFYTWSSSFSFVFLLGFLFSILGFLLSFAYDKGVGRLVYWITKG